MPELSIQAVQGCLVSMPLAFAHVTAAYCVMLSVSSTGSVLRPCPCIHGGIHDLSHTHVHVFMAVMLLCFDCGFQPILSHVHVHTCSKRSWRLFSVKRLMPGQHVTLIILPLLRMLLGLLLRLILMQSYPGKKRGQGVTGLRQC